MNNISDYQAHKRDEQYEIDHAAELDRQWSKFKHCPKHGNVIVAGVGIGKYFKAFGPGGGCSSCFFESDEWQQVKGQA